MTQPKFTRSQEAKAAGWFSRRHETNGPMLAAREWWAEHRSKEARQRRAAERERKK